jgi:hypothetical protein
MFRGRTHVTQASRIYRDIISQPGRVPRPTVGDARLQNLVDDLYRGFWTPHPIGTGSTADAIRVELRTGMPVGGRFHRMKGTQYITALGNWLARHPGASPADRIAAAEIRADLQNALAGR